MISCYEHPESGELPLVSIIVPSYNHGRWIGQCIESVLSQTYEKLELIIVDDASTDNTREVLGNYSSNECIRTVYKTTNSGQGNSINQALDICSGDYICILPSDDYFLADKLKKQVELFRRLPSDFGLVYCNGLRYYEDTRLTRSVDLPKFTGNVLEKLLKWNNFIYPASAMIRRSVFDHLRFDESYRAEGEAIFFKIAENHKIDLIDESLVVMREHSFNTGSNTKLMFEESNRYWSAYFKIRKHIPLVYDYYGLFMGRINKAYGLSFLAHSLNRYDSRKALLLSIKYYPRYALELKVIFSIVLSFLPITLLRTILNAVIKQKA